LELVAVAATLIDLVVTCKTSLFSFLWSFFFSFCRRFLGFIPDSVRDWFVELTFSKSSIACKSTDRSWTPDSFELYCAINNAHIYLSLDRFIWVMISPIHFIFWK
jgi:hypothetical protein